MKIIYTFMHILLISEACATVNTSCASKYEHLFDGHELRITHNTQIKVISMGF